MSKGVKDTFGYLGTEPMALREQLEQLSTALQEMAKAEGSRGDQGGKRCRATRSPSTPARSPTSWPDKAEPSRPPRRKGRGQVEGAIRDQP